MAKSKIFIASSGRTLELAKQLRAQFNQNTCAADLWTEVSQKAAGKPILTMLKEAANEYDFAVIILAKDDIMVTKTGDTLKARDNCVFEAGLFMGVIGETRCFLLSSVPASDLPSDLGGIIYLPFSEPSNLNDPNACQSSTATATTRIESAVWKLGPMGNRPLSQEKLLEREKSRAEGGELLEDQVVVASVQPLDVSFDAARQVRKNIDKFHIRYVYFFEGSLDGAEKTCQFLQMVLLANILQSQSDVDDWPGRLEKLKNNLTGIKQDLEQLCKMGMIKIYFLPEAPALQYCIHNATNDKSAKIYLKRREEYFEWELGPGAYQFWAEVRKARGAVTPQPPRAVFYGVPGFNISDGDFFKTLKNSVRLYFPQMEEDVMRLCLRGPPES